MLNPGFDTVALSAAERTCLPMLPTRSALAALFVAFTAVACAAQTDGEALGSGDSAQTIQNVHVDGAVSTNGQLQSNNFSGAAGSFHALTFRALGNDIITADVGIVGGDAQAFITDIGNNVIGNDTTPGAADARVTATVPQTPTGASRTLHLVYKDKNADSGRYNIRVTIQHGACNPAQGAEPWNTYKSFDVNECLLGGIDLNCSSSEGNFTNNCGCGCERPLP
jgi:hypothetical protein